MKIDLKTIKISDWVIRYRVPESNGPHPVIWLFHGWKGDEESMEIFISKIPEDYLILSPRGRFPEPKGGFGWNLQGKGWPTLERFTPVINDLLELMENWPLEAPWGDFLKFRMAGFSQGAALAYAFMLLFPDRVQAVAGLAGFLPTDYDTTFTDVTLSGIKVYVSHGLYDEIVPIENAREAVRFFDRKGAEVTFCESNVGHKLSAECFKGIEVFFGI